MRATIVVADKTADKIPVDEEILYEKIYYSTYGCYHVPVAGYHGCRLRRHG